ncbi:MAG: MFS transporter [Chloroflexota bacterium]
MSLRSGVLAAVPRDLTLIGASLFLMNVGFSTYGAIYNNFLVNDLHIRPDQLGLLESLREVPGFLVVGMAAVAVRFRESRVSAFALILMGIGLALFARTTTMWQLIAVASVMSVGFHLFMPLNSSLILAASEPGQQGRRSGQMGSVGAAGSLAGMALVLAVVGVLGLRGTFVPAGLFTVAGGVLLYLLQDRQSVARTRVLLRRRYNIYYALTLLDGSRRQIFGTFAVFALIRLYSLDVVHITWLLVLNTIVSILTMPWIGWIIDRAGERRVLVANYACLVFLFAGYALVHNLWLLVVLYCIDNAFFGFSMGINTYLKKIAPPHEVSPSLVMGVTVNHIAAVGVPLVGGMLWNTYGYQITFLAGSATCILAVVAAWAMRVPCAETPA